MRFSEQTKQHCITELPNLIYTKDALDFTRCVMADKPKFVGQVFVKNLEDAVLAKRKTASDCFLIVSEGLSSIAIFKNIAKHIPSFNDNIGLFPLKGKILNTSNEDVPFEIKNDEIENLISIIGL